MISNSNPYEELMAFQRDTEALEQVSGRLGWDQETVMPAKSGDQRAAERGAMSKIIHARRTDPQIAEWLSRADAVDAVASANLRHIKRDHDKMSKVPARLASEIATITSKAQGIWIEARKNEDVASFLPVLETVVALRKEEAQALADGNDLYDALLDNFEPNTSGADIAAMFAAMRPVLVTLRDCLLYTSPSPRDATLSRMPSSA